MKRHYIKLTALLTIITTMLSGCAGCAGCNGNDVPATPTPAITATVAPTEKPVEITPTEVPATPTAVPTPTLEPIATPEPTSTPVPTVAVAPEAKLLDSIKMGDNVWYDFYDDGTLVVRGTGKTRDVECSFSTIYEPRHYVNVICNDSEYSSVSNKYMVSVNNIVVQEGITELGDWSLHNFFGVEKVILPTSLTKIGYAALFNSIFEYTECLGLRTDMEIEKYALSNNLDPSDVLAKEFAEYTVAPTPNPLPTATPLPNPNKPKKYATKQMGDNVIFEFWDNGYLYVKGTGATWDKNYVTFLDFRNEPYCNTHTVIVEEGITYLGDYVFNEMNNVSYYRLPKSLTSISNSTAGRNGNGTTVIEGYYNGKPVTLRIAGTGNPGQFYDKVERIDFYEENYPGLYEVTFE